MRKCFVHIGTPKTGTTSLQAVLTNRYDELKQHGFLYPRSGRGPMEGHHNIAFELHGHHRFKSELGTITDLLNEIDESTSNIVLSSESFCHIACEPKFSDFINQLHHRGLKVFVIVYLRNQIDFIRSHYFESLKNGSELPLNAYLAAMLENAESSISLRRIPLLYHQLLEHQSAIQNAHLLVYSYDEVQPVPFIRHFLSIMGLTPEALGANSELRLNTEYPLREQFKIFYENRVERPLKQAESIVIEHLFEGLETEDLDISADTKNKIIKRCAESNNTIAVEYGVPEFSKMRPIEVRKGVRRQFGLEDIFSAHAQYFVYDLARALSGETYGADVGRLALAHFHHEILSRHQAFTDVFYKVTAIGSIGEPQPAPFPRKPDRLISYRPLAGAYNLLLTEYETLALGYTNLLAVFAESEALLRAYNALMVERDRLLEGHNSLMDERDRLLEAHNSLMAERDRLLEGHTGLMAERDCLLEAHNGLLVERDRLLEGHNSLMDERDRLLEAHTGLMVERDRLLEAHNSLMDERDRLLEAHNGLIVERDGLLRTLNQLIADCGLQD
jgi:hypothetical protein